MENEQYMCYITYAVPKSFLTPLVSNMVLEQTESRADAELLFPPGFMPEWFLKGCFPEDDFED